jgi:hypothetical protein
MGGSDAEDHDVSRDFTDERLVVCSGYRDRGRSHFGSSHQCGQGATKLAHEPPHRRRYSPLDKINTSNVKSLKLAYAVAIGGTSTIENLQSTPLAEDGYLYVVDQWGVLYKIDGRSGDVGRIVWRMDPGQEKLPLSNRGAALWGNLVISAASYRHGSSAPTRRPGRSSGKQI